jgi:nucleoside-diphosphate-sugar epimerase
VYAPDAPSPVTEQSPLVEHVEFAHPYTRQKLLAEMAVWRADTEGRLVATVVRPARAIGAGDPGLLGAMNNLFGNAAGQVFDDWSNQVPIVVVDDLVRGIVLAASLAAEHRAYNMATSYPVTKAQLRDAFVDAGFVVETPPMAKRVVTGALRVPVRVLGLDDDNVTDDPPRFRGKVRRVLCRKLGDPLPNRAYEPKSADADLGWRSDTDYRVAVRQAVEWAHAHEETGAVATS